MRKIVRLQIDMPKSLDPVVAYDTVSGDIISCCYDRLFEYRDGKYKNSLVDDFSYLENNSYYYVKLKKNILFCDGEECTAYDVKYSVERCIEQCDKVKPYVGGKIAYISVINKYELYINVTEEIPNIKGILAINAMSIIEKGGKNGNLEKQTYGTGPYTVSDVKHNKVVLVRNNNWWQGESALDEIDIVANSNYELLKKKFVESKADIMYANPSDVAFFSKLDGVKVERFPALDMCTFVISKKNTALKEKCMRKELRSKVSVNEILAEIKRENASEMNCAIPHGLGYEWSGIKNDKESHEYKIEAGDVIEILIFEGFADGITICNYLKKKLEQFGVRGKILTLPFDQYCHKFDEGDFDIAFLSWAPDIVDLGAYVIDFYYSKGEVARAIGYKNAKVDSLIEESIPDNIDDIIKIAEEDCNYIWLYQGMNIKIYRDTIKNVQHTLWDGDYSYRYIEVNDATNT